MRNIKEKIIWLSIGLVALIGVGIYGYKINKETEMELAQIEQEREKQRLATETYIADRLDYCLQVATVLDDDYEINRIDTFVYTDDYIDWRDERLPKIGKESQNKNYDNLVTIDNTVDEITKQYFYQYLDLAPEYVLNALENKGWKMYLVNGTINEDGNFVTVSGRQTVTSGYTDTSTKEIVIRATELGISATLHEIGHAICYEWLDDVYTANGYTDYDSKDFTKVVLHRENRRYLYEIYEEIKAEMFSEYCMYPQELENYSKSIYSYYENLEKIIERKEN